MSDKHQIEHEGIVEHIDGNIARVRILAKSACASCHANGACPAADMQEKLIDASCDRPYNAGDKVLLIGDNKYGFLAAWWAYVLPLILMLFTLFLTYALTNNENIAGLLSLGILAPYFLTIKLFQHKFSKTFSFTIKPSMQ